MSSEIIYLPVDEAKRFIFDVLTGIGVPSDDAGVCRDVLIASDLKGIDSHGIGRLKMYYDRIKDGVQRPVTRFEIVKETETTAVVDGNHGMGHVIGVRSMEMAMGKAKEYGLGAVAVRNSTHYGIAGYYAHMAAEKDMVGITFTNARPSVAPTYGVTPMLGTNPLTFGAPTDEKFPFVIDCATSISQRGKIELYDRAEKATPEGLAIDGEGRPFTDTKRLLKELETGEAALLPMGGATELFGGHKGYGWSTMVEIMCAALQDGAYLKGLWGFDEEMKRVPYRLGHFFLAADVAHFISPKVFRKIAGDIMRSLRGSKKVAGCPRIYTAGEKEYESEIERQRTGIPVNANLRKNLVAMRDALHLKGYEKL
jgi:LDH2 family malate/lactate/ureidoglycolate dehydrogenase